MDENKMNKKSNPKLKKFIGVAITLILLAGILFVINNEFSNTASQSSTSSANNKAVARKKSKTYKVSFITDNSSTIPSQLVTDKAVAPETPTKNGYIFEGWYLNNKKFDFNTKITKDIVLVAKWKEEEKVAEKVTITFNSDGGKEISPVTIEKGTTIDEPATSKKLYIFKGWYLNDKKFDFKTKIDDSITLVAKWEKENIGSFNEDLLSLTNKTHKEIVKQIGNIKTDAMETFNPYQSEVGYIYYVGGLLTYKNGYTASYNFYVPAATKDYYPYLDNEKPIFLLDIPFKDLFNDYTDKLLEDDNLKTLGISDITYIDDIGAKRFMYKNYQITVFDRDINYNKSGYTKNSYVEISYK